MKRKPIFFLPAVELEQMPTKQLLARLKRLHQCEESRAFSDKGPEEIAQGITFKATPAWATAYTQVKEALAQREHIPNSAAIRLKCAQDYKTASHRNGKRPLR